jgi:hypothetical protein
MIKIMMVFLTERHFRMHLTTKYQMQENWKSRRKRKRSRERKK